jgi:hypothetical protein
VTAWPTPIRVHRTEDSVNIVVDTPSGRGRRSGQTSSEPFSGACARAGAEDDAHRLPSPSDRQAAERGCGQAPDATECPPDVGLGAAWDLLRGQRARSLPPRSWQAHGRCSGAFWRRSCAVLPCQPRNATGLEMIGFAPRRGRGRPRPRLRLWSRLGKGVPSVGSVLTARCWARATAMSSISSSAPTPATIPASWASSPPYRRPVVIASWAVAIVVAS